MGVRIYLSAMLAGFTLSMTMTCLLQYMEVERATPRLEPNGFATSTRSGPEALAMESVNTKAKRKRLDISYSSPASDKTNQEQMECTSKSLTGVIPHDSLLKAESKIPSYTSQQGQCGAKQINKQKPLFYKRVGLELKFN